MVGRSSEDERKDAAVRKGRWCEAEVHMNLPGDSHQFYVNAKRVEMLIHPQEQEISVKELQEVEGIV